MPYTPGDHAPPSPPEPQTADESAAPQETRGCLFALSQPPLMLFLAFIGALLLITATHDLFLL
ncbi:hypothetical protein [Streptomyces gobiensis]|uniref:hypothetical protein n=1 Tax=Streptomyces gobiensis TaxID=2875706 RepID=UPI001E6329FA|nr:hypothetical protein [Streptomyces gobiensis]UGY90417.1 hypothetical protein test1122_00860 [Streptomyces gobiensis]